MGPFPAAHFGAGRQCGKQREERGAKGGRGGGSKHGATLQAGPGAGEAAGVTALHFVVTLAESVRAAKVFFAGLRARFPAMLSLIHKKGARSGFLDGQLLIAMPGMEDERFARSVIYLCAHSSDGAMGIMINQPSERLTFAGLLVQLDIIEKGQEIRLPQMARRMTVHRGGPLQTERGFVLHSSDYFIENSTLPIDDKVCLTATLEILKAIASGAGPRSAILALGYAAWGPGQLEGELKANGWLHAPASPDLVFDAELDHKYERAMGLIGIDPVALSPVAGHA